MTVTHEEELTAAPEREERPWRARLREEPSARTMLLCLIGLAALSTLIRAALVSRVQAPTVFNDELGYSKLAASIGRDGTLALFDKSGLSYSPLYPMLLAPIYALGASAPTAYECIKVVNALLVSLAVFPMYRVARFAVPRRTALLACALLVAAPLMLYSSFVMSESLALPVSLLAIWAMLATIRTPSLRNDALLLLTLLVAFATRVQLFVLVPTAVTAIVLAAVLHRDGHGVFRSLAETVRRHALLFGAGVAVVAVAGARAIVGGDVLSLAGRYAELGRRDFPDVTHLLNLAVRHLAGLDVALGFAPFVAALVAAFVFVRSGFPRRYVPFASVAVSLVAWLLFEIAFDAAIYDAPNGSDAERIHERFLIYAMPLFWVALLAAFRLTDARASKRVYLAAAAVAALLPVVIPFDIVVNNTIGVDTFGLQPFAWSRLGILTAVPHATLAAVWAGVTFSLLYVEVRKRPRTVVMLVLIPFVLIFGLARGRIESASRFTRGVLPAQADWVDRAVPAGDVTLVAASGPRASAAALETAFYNLSIKHAYTLCGRTFGPDFGEERPTIDAAGRVKDSSGYVEASRVVVPWSFGVQGRIVTWNDRGGQALIAPPSGPLVISPAQPIDDFC